MREWAVAGGSQLCAPSLKFSFFAHMLHDDVVVHFHVPELTCAIDDTTPQHGAPLPLWLSNLSVNETAKVEPL